MGKSKNRIKKLLLLTVISLSIIEIYSFWPRPYKWVFVYYMSYDNNLNECGDKIISQLAHGISDNKIAVVLQADFLDSCGMKRIELYHHLGITERKDTLVQSEDSADPNELKKYFDWVRNNWKAENYCVVFLNHGGMLNSMCKDENPSRQQSSNDRVVPEKWLSAMEVGRILADFNRVMGGKVRLLFLQQCARASIQNLYNFTDGADYILASPFQVGAPSTYYMKTLKTVTKNPNMTGDTLARSIMKEDEQYTAYTLIGRNELKELPRKLQPVLDSFTKIGELKPAQECQPVFEYEGDKFYDLKLFFQFLDSANKNIAAKELNEFFDWCDNRLIIEKQFKDFKSDYKLPDKSLRCGLSIYVPSDPNQLGRYDFLPFYKEAKLESLMRLTLQ